MGEKQNMKIALICPSNLLYMPYLDNYREVLNKCEANYDIINWDRFHIEPSENPLTYRDAKVGHTRNLLDYYKYKRFVVNKLKSKKYDKIIVFGIQLAFFLKSLFKKYKNKFILDIRDYNKVISYFDIKKVVNYSAFTVISSPGFKKWLPLSGKYITNHNTRVDFVEDLTDMNFQREIDKKINLSYIGTIRDLNINMKLISSLKNNKRFNLYFHGEGIINKEIEAYLKDKEISNAFLTGRYNREDEDELYANGDFINVLIPNTDINSQTLLPNRLYNAVNCGKPIITFKGTFVAQLVLDNNLGLVIDSFIDLDKQIERYLSSFDEEIYKKNRFRFLNNVISENKSFNMGLINFINRRN